MHLFGKDLSRETALIAEIRRFQRRALRVGKRRALAEAEAAIRAGPPPRGGAAAP